LKTTTYNNGDPIVTGLDSSEWLHPNDIPAYSIYDDDLDNAAIYGNLYNWYAATDPRGICPAGFRLPSLDDWTELVAFLSPPTAGAAMMECTEGSCPASDYWFWALPNTVATNSSGFTGLPGGYRMSWGDAPYGNISMFAYFWASDDTPINFPEGDERLNGRSAYYRMLKITENGLKGGRLNTDLIWKATGLSVRCILDN